jgi:hypothetical protein
MRLKRKMAMLKTMMAMMKRMMAMTMTIELT